MDKIRIAGAGVLAACLATAVHTPAHAHGPRPHAGKPAPVVKEQKDWGIAGEARQLRRTIMLAMDDSMRFTPDTLRVAAGETIRLRMKNRGKLRHELVLGTLAVLEEHAALMMKFPNMEHDEPYMAHVDPGRTGEIIWTFNRPGEFDFACLIGGHYQAGMRGKVIVAASSAPAPAAASAPAAATSSAATKGS